ncbi:MAG: OmpA family protein [Archangiaceae bacterium]|nr:OmpA family protein [Archangiaceae bacterium]
MKGSILLAAWVVALPALAQNDEWTTFPANQPPPAETPKKADPPKKKDEPRKDEPAPPHQDPSAKGRVEERLRAAEAGRPIPQNSPAPGAAATSSDGLPVVSRRERVEPGTEHHSPSTWGHGLQDENHRTTVGAVGIGLIHLQSAKLGPKGVLRFSLLGEYNNLNDFPVRTAQNIRSSGTFAVSWVPVSFLEAYLGYSATANTNSRTSPNLIQALGDLTLGVKGAIQLSKNADSALRGFYLGLDLRLLTFSAVGNQSIDRFAVGFKPSLIATYDFRALTYKFPVVFSLNLGATIDSTSGLVTNQTLNASEEFALAINRYNRIDFGFGVEVPFPVVTPFIEYTLAGPLGVPGNQFTGPDGVRVDVTSAMPQKLGLGLKVTAVKDLTLALGFDLGLARSVGLGMAATAPWNFLFNASFNIDPFQRGETKIVETVRERTAEKKVAEAPKTGKVEGTVVDAKTNKPISGVLVAMVGSGLPPVASDAEGGRFLTYDLPPGPVKLKASRDGYKDIEQELKVETGKSNKVQLSLEPVEKLASFVITVSGNKKPIAANVVVAGTETKTVSTVKDVKEPVKVEASAGTYTVSVTAEGFLSQQKDVALTAGAELPLAFELAPAPKKMLAIIKDDKIEIAQQVHFATGKATILADSYSLLQQVVDVMVKNNVKRVRVEGHTDNRGDKAFNQKLSEDRAASVASYLIGQGIDPRRIESAGFGDSKPVAPNLTARGRELNRRVEFLILEK